VAALHGGPNRHLGRLGCGAALMRRPDEAGVGCQSIRLLQSRLVAQEAPAGITLHCGMA
jgi:hypothetical protein